MFKILLLYNRELKNSPLDSAVKKWAKRNRARLIQHIQHEGGILKEKPNIIIVRQSMLNTQFFEEEGKVEVINPYKARVLAKDKFLLDKKLKELGIQTPLTIPYSESPKVLKNFSFPLILKPIVGAKGYGVVDIETQNELKSGEKTRRFGTKEMLQKHFLLQEKIDGHLYKVYGPYRGKWFFMNKNTGEEGFVPARIAHQCATLLQSYGLYYMGIDFIVKNGVWYAIDANGTTGCKSLSRKNCQKFVDFLLRKFARKTRIVISAGGIIFREFFGKLKVAMVLDPKKDRQKNTRGWVFPRGHIEKGESLRKTALREIEEESGLQKVHLLGEVGVIKKFGREPDGERVFKLIHYFGGYCLDKKQSKPHPKDKHTETQWFDPSEAYRKCYYKKEAQLLKKIIESQ